MGIGGREIIVPFKPISTILIAVLLILNGFLVLRSDIFQVKNLNFEFEQISDEALVRQRVSESVLGRSIFFLNLSEIEAGIKKDFPTIKAVEVEKDLPDRLSVKVIVRVPLAVIEDINGAKFLTDEEGLLFRVAADEKLPLIKLGNDFVGEIGATVSEQGVASYLETLNLVSQKGFAVQGIYLHSSSIELRLKGTTVWLAGEDKISDQVEVLVSLLQRYKVVGKTPKSVDLRFARPVVRL